MLNDTVKALSEITKSLPIGTNLGLLHLLWMLITGRASGVDVPLMIAGDFNGHRVALLPFDLYDSDLPLQIAWPILVSDLTAWFRTPHAIDIPNGLQIAGTLPIRALPDADTVRVKRPDGAATTFRPADGLMIYAEAQLPGSYAVESYKGADLLQSESFAVNLFAPLESRIAPAASINVGNIQAQAAQTKDIGQREYWPWIALVGLIVLCVEWYVYQYGGRWPTLRRRTPNKPNTTTALLRSMVRRWLDNQNHLLKIWTRCLFFKQPIDHRFCSAVVVLSDLAYRETAPGSPIVPGGLYEVWSPELDDLESLRIVLELLEIRKQMVLNGLKRRYSIRITSQMVNRFIYPFSESRHDR